MKTERTFEQVLAGHMKATGQTEKEIKIIYRKMASALDKVKAAKTEEEREQAREELIKYVRIFEGKK